MQLMEKMHDTLTIGTFRDIILLINDEEETEMVYTFVMCEMYDTLMPSMNYPPHTNL